MRIMALDVGTKRIGVAVSDELSITAQGLETIERKGLPYDLDTIRDLAKERLISEIVVGLPLNMNGTHSAKTKEVVEFMDSLAKAVDMPVKMWDERLTSLEAERRMLEADISRAKRKRLSDKLAAQIILQSYLDAKKRRL